MEGMESSGSRSNTGALVSFWAGLFAFLNLMVLVYGLAGDDSWLMDDTGGLWLVLPFFAFAFGIAAIILGITGWRQAKKSSAQPRIWHAQAGLLAGVVTVGAMLVAALVAAAVITIFILASPEG